ncbi:MAG TPA: tetratricopeptide repeat protein [Allosphingosinicella sp.]|nr:tetratricopeptide repeat protein [Allosphingosinicella sp.]
MASTPTQPPPPPAGPGDRLAGLVSRGKWLFAAGGLAATVFSSILTAYLYLENRVDAVVSAEMERRMMPYERYMAANMMASNDDPDRCADTLDALLPELESEEFRTLAREPFYDLALACARDAAYPAKYRGYVKGIEAALARGLAASSGWHKGALGQYYLRTGDLDAAERDLVAAASMLSAEGWPSEEAQAHWWLALLHLARGRPAEAAARYREAARLDPRSFEPAVAERNLVADIDQPKLRFLRDNPAFRRALPGFLAALRATGR